MKACFLRFSDRLRSMPDSSHSARALNTRVQEWPKSRSVAAKPIGICDLIAMSHSDDRAARHGIAGLAWQWRWFRRASGTPELLRGSACRTARPEGRAGPRRQLRARSADGFEGWIESRAAAGSQEPRSCVASWRRGVRFAKLLWPLPLPVPRFASHLPGSVFPCGTPARLQTPVSGLQTPPPSFC